jgi:hypothetical protein
VTFVEKGQEPAQFRAYTTRVQQTTLWNLQSLGPERDTNWQFIRYSFTEEGHLVLQVVNPDAFGDVGSDAPAVRQQLEDNLENSEFFGPVWDCTAVQKSTNAE